ncbi:FAD-dependent monooxygenase [Actinophytocola sp.]|uniref:FAD-dependent monooxygenase n=1 Tax=Actinophytocola sp. TaxID=1872138 RepID=UPI002D356EAA|nr:FAD-dependent monooxygenase [Actinophytocola sp.]HYQ62653.1 FAD-dependent monooxygenase [Actinophytocola sp.]
MKRTTVLISGAGVAGITLAYWLRRNGFTPTVVERARSVRDGGHKIDIRGAALPVVERMGLLDQIRERATGVRVASFVDHEGRRLASMDGDAFGGRGHDDAEILRGDLLRLLFEATEGVEYLWGEEIADLHQTADHVEVTFARGVRRRFDLVIGADGVHSVTREKVFGPGHVRDLGHRVAVAAVPNHLDLDREEVTYASPGRTVIVYSTAHDTGAKAMFLLADDQPVPADAHRYLADRFADAGWEVPTLLANAGDDVYLDAVCQVHLDRWSSHRVALVGDAAYCASVASGQGTSLALVGAYVLAGELAAARDHAAGFAAYEAELREFVAINQKMGPANIKRMVLRGRAGVWLSMKMLSLLWKLPIRDKMIEKVTGPIDRAANAITLKHYPVRCFAA